MGVTRGKLAIDEHFTPVPNEWARDARLSRRARGLLVEIMSHRVGWHISIRSLARSGKEGRDAIQTALNELVECGYLRREQERDAGGHWSEIEYVLCDPPTVAGFSGRGEEIPGQTVSGSTVSGSTVSGSTVSGESDHKEDHFKEDHFKEDHLEELFAIDVVESAEVWFDRFWSIYPRKDAKKPAREKFERIIASVNPEIVVSGARRYADATRGSDPKFVALPTTWLNQERWADETVPSASGESVMESGRRSHDILVQLAAGQREVTA